MQMDIKFELKPKQRPKLAEEIATALHTVPCYQKAPSLTYKIGDCTLERDGTLRIPDGVDREAMSRLLEHLKEKGFTGEAEQMEDKLTVSIPRDLFTQGALENLAKLVENSSGLSHPKPQQPSKGKYNFVQGKELVEISVCFV